MAARVYRSTLAAVAAANPTGGAAQKDFRDYDLNAGATYDRVDTGTVPTTPFAIELDLAALRNFGVTITVGGVARTKVRYGTQASGQVGVDFVNGRIQFYSGDAGGSYSVTYRGRGSVITATDMNILQNEIAYLRTAAATFVVGPSSATDNAAMRYDGTTGKLAQDSLLIIADNGNTSTVGTLSASNLSGTNSGDLTLSGAAILALMSLTGQALSLDTQAANYVMAGPTSGSAAAPTFRTLVDADMDSITVLARTDSANNFAVGQIFEAATVGNSPTVNSNTLAVAPNDLVKVAVYTTGVDGDSGGDTNDWTVVGIAESTSHPYTLRLPGSSGTYAVGITGTAYASFSAVTGIITFSAVNLASHITGTLGVANGGTGATGTPTSGGVAYGGSSILNWSSAGTSGMVLRSGGSGAPTWVTMDYETLDFDVTGTTAGAAKSYTIPAATLATNGDCVVIRVIAEGAGDPINFQFGGSTRTSYTSAAGVVEIEITITRISNTEVRWVAKFTEDAGAVSVKVAHDAITSLNLTSTGYSAGVTFDSSGNTIAGTWNVSIRRV